MTRDVLIADDSEFMRKRLHQILEEEFNIVDEAENGAEAVKKYDEHNPDIVIIDVLMPIKDGIEAAYEIKNKETDTQVVMSTSMGHEDKMEEAIEAGADGYINKPFIKQSVIETINELTQK